MAIDLSIENFGSMIDHVIAGICFFDYEDGKFIPVYINEFNSNALYLGGAPWIIKSYTQKHITIIQNEISPDKEKVATIELEKID